MEAFNREMDNFNQVKVKVKVGEKNKHSFNNQQVIQKKNNYNEQRGLLQGTAGLIITYFIIKTESSSFEMYKEIDPN